MTSYEPGKPSPDACAAMNQMSVPLVPMWWNRPKENEQ